MRIGITGCGGRMGRLLVEEVLATDGCDLAGGTGRPGSAVIGTDVAAQAELEPVGLTVTEDPRVLFATADAVVDCTTPATAIDHVELAAEHGRVLVLGTTGLGTEHLEAVDRAAARTAIVQAVNTSVGVNLLIMLTEKTAAILGDDWDIEIVEMHHRTKVDAPSGTALVLGRAAARGRGVDFEGVARTVRDGEIGRRPPGDIGFASLRGGDVTGEHAVIFAGIGERIELTQRNFSRALYARGAVRAALWAAEKPPGRYSMGEVLGFG